MIRYYKSRGAPSGIVLNQVSGIVPVSLYGGLPPVSY
jgi:hypothetical protein